MSLYEPNSAEANEALHTNINSVDQPDNAEVNNNVEAIFRLPDLDQIDAEPEKATVVDQTKVDQTKHDGPYKNALSEVTETEEWETEMVARSKSFNAPSSPDKDRWRKIATTSAKFFFVGVLGFGLAHVISIFFADIPNYDCPAPDAPLAPKFESLQYASDEATPKDSTSFELPVDLTTPSLQMSNSGSMAANGGTAPNVKQLMPPTTSRIDSHQVAASLNLAQHTTIPKGPNVGNAPVFTHPTATTQNTASNNTPYNPYQTGQQQYVPPTRNYNRAPMAQVTEADRFSQDRVQEVLRNRDSSIQTMNYPQTQASPHNPAVYYSQNSTPAVAQQPNPQQYPVHMTYPTPTQNSSTTVPPVSPYPPTGYAPPTTQYQTTQNWPGQTTNVTPSTPQPQQQLVYPSTGYTVPRTAAQPPYYQGQVYR